MSSQFSVETGSIAESAALTKQVEADVSETIAGLMQRTQATLAEWTGPAANAYRAALTQWETDAKQILTALDGTSRALTRLQNNYDETEATHVRGLENLTYSL
jgi:WXG100 family type VII secretion target